MKMKKILATLFLAILFQGVAETVVKGTYDTKKKRYTELSQTFEKEINLSYVLPNDKKDTVTYKTENYDILVRKSDLLELYNRKREKKENNIKDNISDKDKKLDYVRNYIAELVESNRAVIYERKTKKEIKNIVKVKYNNDIYYDAGRGSNYDGYKFTIFMVISFIINFLFFYIIVCRQRKTQNRVKYNNYFFSIHLTSPFNLFSIQ